MEEEEEEKKPSLLPSPKLWLTKLITLQAELFLNCLLALLSPLCPILTLLSAPEESKESVKFAIRAATGVPSKVVHGTLLLVKKVGFGILAAAYVGMILTALLVASCVMGFGLVQCWVEEPLNLRERLHFDYSLGNPEAVFSFGHDGVYGFERGHMQYREVEGMPIGHTTYVSVVLLLPESDYNIEVGVFQLNAELITSNGAVMTKATRPCMLRFSSWPIWLVRVLTMSVPLLLGITEETQTITVPMIMHKERFPRTGAVRITMVPRAGTNYVPQVYEAELVLKSQPPWKKELVRRWRWTFSVWISFYVYFVLLLVLLFSSRQLILPVMIRDVGSHPKEDATVEAPEKGEQRPKRAASIAESLKRWKQSRSRRRVVLRLSDIDLPEQVRSSASSISFTGGDTGTSTFDEDSANCGSVCCSSGLDD